MTGSEPSATVTAAVTAPRTCARPGCGNPIPSDAPAQRKLCKTKGCERLQNTGHKRVSRERRISQGHVLGPRGRYFLPGGVLSREVGFDPKKSKGPRTSDWVAAVGFNPFAAPTDEKPVNLASEHWRRPREERDVRLLDEAATLFGKGDKEGAEDIADAAMKTKEWRASELPKVTGGVITPYLPGDIESCTNF
jgi:hypothetical protein